jgi:hypothetical protein
VLLLGTGLVVCAVWGLALPRLDSRIRRHPKWLASDPEALARFRRTNSRQGVIAGVLLVVIGTLLLVAAALS